MLRPYGKTFALTLARRLHPRLDDHRKCGHPRTMLLVLGDGAGGAGAGLDGIL